jgi:glycosyltransferase 2 family protein
MHKVRWRIFQALVALTVMYFLARVLAHNWTELRSTPITWQLRWEYIGASLIVTWAMYGFLIWGWRSILHGWRQWIKAVDAARVWTVASLGQFVPGKVWAIAGMAVMAQRSGVSGAAAMGSAIVMQLVALATGAVLALALTGTQLLDQVPGGGIGAIVLAVLALIAVMGLTVPSVTRRIGFVIRRPDAMQPVDPGALAGALLASLIAWAGYGVALQLLALGTMTGINLSWTDATGAYAAAYIIGYLAFFIPGGLGVREAALAVLLRGEGMATAPAVALALASRVAVTINQFGAAVPFLPSVFSRRPLHDDV